MNRYGRYSLWLFGLGYKDWKSGGVKVVYYGLIGIVSIWEWYVGSGLGVDDEVCSGNRGISIVYYMMIDFDIFVF